MISPIEIRRIASIRGEQTIGDGLEVSWADGFKCLLTSKSLRAACPCATCQESRGETQHQKPFSKPQPRLQVISATADEALNLKQVSLVGNYAVTLVWGDRHDTGIYSFQLLRELGEQQVGEEK